MNFESSNSESKSQGWTKISLWKQDWDRVGSLKCFQLNDGITFGYDPNEDAEVKINEMILKIGGHRRPACGIQFNK